MLFGEKTGKWRNGSFTMMSHLPGSAAVLGEESYSVPSPSTVIFRSYFLQILTLPETQDWAEKSFCFSRRNSTNWQQVSTPTSEDVVPMCFQQWQYCCCKCLCAKEQYIDGG